MNSPANPPTKADQAPAAEFHLFVEVRHEIAQDGPPPLASGERVDPPVVVVPSGPSTLKFNPEGLPTAVAPPPGEVPDDPMVEPIRNQHGQPRLLVVAPSAGELRVNGTPTGPVKVLSAGDQFHFKDDVMFEVAVYQRPQVGVPAPAVLGEQCSVCGLAFIPETRVYTCGHCGSALHCEDSADGLQCARLSKTCTCGQPICFEEGYRTRPEWL